MRRPPLLPHPAYQIVDSGLDETSCFFVDGDGQEVTHGYYFDEMSESYSSVSVPAFTKFQGGDFSFEPSRRKVSVRLGFHASYVALFGMSKKMIFSVQNHLAVLPNRR